MPRGSKFKLCKANKPGSKDGVINFTLTSLDVDRDSEVILPMGGKVDNFLKNPVFLWAHDMKMPPIGKIIPESLQITEREITADVEFDLKDEFAKKIYEKYVDGFLNAGSIRFIPIEMGEPILEGQHGPTFIAWELLEFSAVPVPANQNALANRKEWDDGTTFAEKLKGFLDNDNFDHTPEGWLDYLEKTFKEPEQKGEDDEVKAVVSFSPTEKADEKHPWSASQADKRLRAWAAGGGEFDLKKASIRNKYRKGFTYVEGDGTKLSDYKLPHHDIVDGKLAVVWRGVAAAMAALLGARGGVSIPDADRKAVYNHLVKHYKQFEKKPPEFKAVDDFVDTIVSGEVRSNDAFVIIENDESIGIKSIVDVKVADGLFLAQYNLEQWEGVAKAMSDLADADYLEPVEKEKIYNFLCVKYKQFGQEPPELKFEQKLESQEDELDIEALLSDEKFIQQLTETVVQNLKGDDDV